MTTPGSAAAPETPSSTPPAGAPTPANMPGAKPPSLPEERFVDNFPEGKAIADMSLEEQNAYWRNYAHKHEKAAQQAMAGKFEGLTAKEIADMRAENEALKTEKMTADEKILNAAKKEAATAAATAAKAEYLPQIQALQVKSIASQVIQGDKLNAFMAIVNPAALVGADGAVDETMVMGHLTAMYGDAAATPPPPGQRWQNAGQFSPPPPGVKPGAAGSAEAAKRFGTKTT